MARITTLTELRAHYGEPRERSRRKTLPALDRHCRRFIELSPFIALGTFGGDGRADVSPRGDMPGFIRMPDAQTLLIPDRPGNNRLDNLTNLLANPAVGLLFVIPGIDETLRVNGTAAIHDDADLLDLFAVNERRPATVLKVTVSEAYLHCGKAMMRSRLWDPEFRVERSLLPSMGEMLRDQLALDTPAESQAEMMKRYRETLY